MPWYDSDNPDRWIVSGGIRLMLIIVVGVIFFGALAFWWAPWKGQIEERNQTVGSGAYRIQAYEWYYDECSAIQTAEQTIDNYKSQLDATPPPSSDQAVRLQSGITGETNVWIELVNEYNANARKEKTKGQFKDDGLPDYIDPTNLNDGKRTTCS